MHKSIEGKTIEMTYVDTKMLSYVGYDEKTQALAIEFCRGPVHVYDEVPKDIYEGLLSAAAVDDFFNEKIRNTYKNRRVN